MAQNDQNRWGFGVHLETIEYSGELGHEFFGYNQKWSTGFSVSRYMTPCIDLVGHFFWGKADANEFNRFKIPSTPNFTAGLYNLDLMAKFKFNNGYNLKEEALFAPYVLGGLSAGMSSTNGFAENGPILDQTLLFPALAAGVGLRIRYNSAVSFAVQSIVKLPATDQIDGLTGGGERSSGYGNDQFLQSSIAIIVTPGKSNKKDSDGDGVPDKLDKCPDTPKGVSVDSNGCPMDSDQDGVPDYLDKCPDTPIGVKVDENGCPIDSDKDGIPDYRDDCPDVFGLAAFNGCPDSDGDGVPDKEDRCPNTPSGYKVDKFGCPVDADHDGIPDSEDDCPQKPGVAELKGCPYTVQSLLNKYNINMKPISFAFDSYQILPEGVQALEQIATALSNHKDFGVQFDGHTDYVGAEEYNLKLSDKRANSAKTFLINKGIGENQIRLQHFGETKPAADNKTSKGRALNRRVEYSLFELGK